MRISRRNLLIDLGIKIPVILGVPTAVSGESPFKSFQLVLSGITADTPAEALLKVIEPFVRALIPLGCIVAPMSKQGSLEPQGELANLLRRIIADYPTQIEILLDTPALTDHPYFFQARQATRARRALEDAMVMTDTDHHLARSLLTLASFGGSLTFDPRGVMEAGFRTVLSLPTEGAVPVDSQWVGGTLHIFGGLSFGLDTPFADVETAFLKSARNDARVLLNLSVAGLNAENAESAFARMTHIATMISDQVRWGQIVPTTPQEFHRTSLGVSNTTIGLRVDVQAPPDAPQSAAAQEFVAMLRTRNIAFTLAGPFADAWHSDDVLTCATNAELPQSRCFVADAADVFNVMNAPEPPKILMIAPPAIDPISGIDHNATLHPARVMTIDTTLRPEIFVENIKMLADTILVIDSQAYSTVAQQRVTTAIIQTLDTRHGYDLTDVATFVDRLQTPDPIRDVYYQTRHVMTRESPDFESAGNLDPVVLRKDAALAWRYFENLLNKETGLIPSTANIINGATAPYDFATMWDIGSQIFGMIAAAKLGLLAVSNLRTWAEQLVLGLPTVTVQGLKLPSSVIHIAGAEPPRRSFTSCDVGRLLNAFDGLRSFVPELHSVVEDKVGQWELQGSVRKGRMQDLSETNAFDQYNSHCTDYAAAGYAKFGFSADRHFAQRKGPGDADDLINLLYGAATIGAIGAEPLLLEGIETGFTPTSQYLADMLFAAQLEDHRATGRMRCVSESPLDRAPWFTYQGFRTDNDVNPWWVGILSDEPEFQTPEFQRSIEVTSVKAAYLWAATHPHSYSHALVDYVRDRARIEEFGFSSGIYMQNGRAMENYSDLNTNAIILQAIAALLT